MFKQSKLSISISAVSFILLTACGGGGSSFTGDNDPTFVLDKSKQPIEPANVTPISVDKFMRFMADQTDNSQKTTAGQQLSPIVVSIDHDNDQKVGQYDSVRFDQPGIVSTICAWDPEKSCHDNGVFSQRVQAVNDARAVVAKAQEDLKNAQEEVAAAKAKYDTTKAAADKAILDEKTELAKKANDVLSSAEGTLREAEQANAVPGPTGTLQSPAPREGVVVMRDVNGEIHNIYYNGTIDMGWLKSVNVEKLISSPDAGISKIERIRIRDKNGNATLQPYGGSIGAEFNEVVVFDRNGVPEDSGKVVPEEIQYLDAYFRSPATAGWSYQTFGSFKSKYLDNRRDLLVGYQSIGTVTGTVDKTFEGNTLPDQKFAEYRGISHAHINTDKQVTMHNYIRANFKNRTLEYKTLDQAVLHTFEGPNKTHVIEMRPDLNISGSASWDKGVPKFRGSVQTASGLTGKMDGRFYGPRAAEIGGVFGIEGVIDGIESHYIGGFGAKRD